MEKLENKVISAICYFASTTPIILVLGVLIIIFNNSDYVKFHTNQGLVLYLVSFGSAAFINMVLDAPHIVTYLLLLISILIMTWGILNALKGETKEIPVIGKIHLIKNSYQEM